MRLLFLVYFILVTVCSLSAQEIPVGTWRTHFTYRMAHSLALTPEGVYCASSNALFYFDKKDKSLKTMTKNDGLSDSQIADIAYHESLKTLIVAYKNGNIDVLKDDEIINVRSLINATQIAKKIIYSITLHKNNALLATNFGLVILDIDKTQIKDTYLDIGTAGKRIPIFASAVTQESIFLATSEGLRVASQSPQINKLDFNNWQTIVPSTQIRTITVKDNIPYFGIDGEGVYAYRNNQKVLVSKPLETSFYTMTTRNNRLLIASKAGLYELRENTLEKIITDKLSSPRKAYFDQQNKLWAADVQQGLVTNTQGKYEALFPQSVYADAVAAIRFLDGKIIATSGGKTEKDQAKNHKKGFYVFENGKWQNFNAQSDSRNATLIPDINDLIAVAYSPKEQRYYFASFGQGILVWDKQRNTFSTLNKTNTPDFPNNRVSDVSIDNRGNLWATFYGVSGGQASILKKTPQSDRWESFRFQGASYPLEIVLDDAENVWVRLSPSKGGKILVFDANGDRRFLSTLSTDGGLPTNQVLAIKKDKIGHIWVGTQEGLRVFVSPSTVIKDARVKASRVFFNNRTLFRYDKITAIEVDGANNKWIATEEGLWLFDDDATLLFDKFTTQNSPLPSNNIVSMAIHDATGELFVGTTQGIVSYRGKATEAVRKHQNVNVFPNPVSPDHQGLITISGLTLDGIVKITDINGLLIHQTMAQGGTAVWNGLTYNGQKAQTGIYLVFSSSEDGQESFVAKIAIVR